MRGGRVYGAVADPRDLPFDLLQDPLGAAPALHTVSG